MAFFNEFIPADDVVKYGIEAIDESYSVFTYEPDWTVDRERDVYLRQMTRGREEFSNRSTWSLYWKGFLIRLILDSDGGELAPGERFMDYILVRIEIPQEIGEKRDEIINDLKEALTVHNFNGMYTTSPVSKSTFNF